MNEVTKLYENAGIKPYIYCSKPRLDCDARETGNCKQDCEYYSGEGLLTPFNAEKQLLLLGLLARKYGEVHIINNTSRGMSIGIEGISFNLKDFGETIAMVLNTFWQDLTEEDKQQVKGILE